MTIPEMARKGIQFYARSTWPSGQYAHATHQIADEAGNPGGLGVCFCAAPILASDPETMDDLWLPYTGPEVAQAYGAARTPEGLIAVVAAVGEMLARQGHEEVMAAGIPDVEPWQISKPMDA